MPTSEDRAFLHRAVETSLRIALIAVLVIWCFQMVRPFLHPMVWGIILAIAIHPAHVRLTGMLAGRARLSATILVVGSLVLLIVPSVLITSSLVTSATELATSLLEGETRVPPPPAVVGEWPFFGGWLYGLWSAASQNLDAALGQLTPQLKVVGQEILTRAASAGLGIVTFALSIVIAGVLLTQDERGTDVARRVARRLAEERGDQLVELTAQTVQSVTRGILGVALIQAVLAGAGMLAAGVPAAGLWSLLVLLLATVQLPAVLLLGPIIVYVFATSTTVVAVLFAIWTLAVSLSDNVLKPMLLGRGVDVPMLVIFVGAIGGFIMEGLIGLFVGAVLLAVAYRLFNDWLDQGS